MPKPNTARTATRTCDASGCPIVLVPLANHPQPAMVDAQDFDRIMAEGVSPRWTLNDNGSGQGYVRCPARTKGQLATVARLIARARPGERIRYLNGDRLDLRSVNIIKEGKAKLQLGRRPACNPLPSEKPKHV